MFPQTSAMQLLNPNRRRHLPPTPALTRTHATHLFFQVRIWRRAASEVCHAPLFERNNMRKRPARQRQVRTRPPQVP